jgi:hypothetical protein
MNAKSSNAFPGWVLMLACVLAALSAITGASAQGEPTPSMRPIAGPTPNGSATPAAVLPPGAFYPDPGPGDVIYPRQKLTIRFNHKKHVGKDVGLKCVDCHTDATKSVKAADRMMPPPATCDGCHGSNHADLQAVVSGEEGFGSCDMCHAGWRKGQGNAVLRLELPTPHLRSNHKVHADRNIGCESCHGAVQEVELATREQLPRMRGCLGCHAMSGPSRGKAKNDCNTCHETKPDGLLRTTFAEGPMQPPRWMGSLEHTADFLERHKRVAADNSQTCGQCHSENYCTDCHDGRVRPRSVHPNDYISMHPIEARLDNPRCTSCHQEQQFCLPCHTRSGVTKSGSPGSLKAQGRFHPPARIWSDPPRTRQHHAWEAQRNLNACVSCHTERDCAVCHASQSVGGRGFNPHPAGFASKCASVAQRNPRPCMVCHDTASPRDLCR